MQAFIVKYRSIEIFVTLIKTLEYGFKSCLHVPSPCPSPLKSLSKSINVPMVTDCLTDRLSSEPILSINVNLMVTVTETEVVTVGVNGL